MINNLSLFPKQKQTEIKQIPLVDQRAKLSILDDIVTFNRDFLIGYILKDSTDLLPQTIKELIEVVELILDAKDCEIINKNIFFDMVVVLSHVCQNIQKHKITKLMQFYEESIDGIMNDSDYLNKKFFTKSQENEINIRKTGSIVQVQVNKSKTSKIHEPESRIKELESRLKISEMRVSSLVRISSDLAECPICMVEIKHQNISVLACGHIYHKQCFQLSMQEAILNKRFPLKCPNEECEKNVETQDVEEYLGKDLIEKYYEFTLHNFVDKNSKNISWCPTPGCTNAYEFDEGTENLDCPKCSKSYCLQCKTESHMDRTCEQNRQMMNLSKEDREFLKFVKGAKYKQCPECKFWVSKNKGCCHMTCRCSYEFCYVCGSKYGECNCKETYANYYYSPERSEYDNEEENERLDVESDSRSNYSDEYQRDEVRSI